ncbi:unnamed protein product [Owenia fusiformis]|uniref:Uncharacterized protein n=2 Tax=Owenia fusiformis TaxID=6347 RepID=A0A8S4NF45_OWEFU|nr:unnamed protein product [Owenia fusiformis]
MKWGILFLVLPLMQAKEIQRFGCSFESDEIPQLCGLTTYTLTDEVTWKRVKAADRDVENMPLMDHSRRSPEGHYVYLNADGQITPGPKWETRLATDILSGFYRRKLVFWYRLYGQDWGTLSVYTRGPAVHTEKPYWALSGNQGDQWQKAEVVLPTGEYRVVFEGRIINATNKAWTGEIGIDDIRLYDLAYPHVTAHPFVQWKREGGKVNFKCVIIPAKQDDNTPIKYEVNWFSNDKKITSIPETLDGITVGTLPQETWRQYIGTKLSCKVRSIFHGDTEFGPWVESNGYFAGIQILNSGLAVNVTKGKTQGGKVKFRMTVPPSCEDPDCELRVSMKEINDRVDPYNQRKMWCGKEVVPREDKLLMAGDCTYRIKASTWDEIHEIEVKAMGDSTYQDAGTSNKGMMMMVEEEVGMKDMTPSFWQEYTVPDITIMVKTEPMNIEGAVCKSINDPHLTTFDGCFYNNYFLGEYVLYKHKTMPFEVHAIYKECQGASCNCAVAVKVTDDVIVIDRCGKKEDVVVWGDRSFESKRLKRTLFQNGELASGTKLIQSNDGKRYEIHFPTGTYVVVVASDFGFVNAHIYPSSADYGLTEGLCGKLDNYPSCRGRERNCFDWDRMWVEPGCKKDLKMRDGSDYAGEFKDYLQPTPFLMDWRINSSANSLYNGTFQNKQAEMMYPKKYCRCMDPDNGPAEFVTCTPVDPQEVCTEGYDIINHMQPRIHRKKRSADGDGYVTDDFGLEQDDDADEFPFDFELKDHQPTQTWPTPSGWTLERAVSHCERLLSGSFAGRSGCDGIRTVPFDDVPGCIADIQLADGPKWANDALDSYKEKCSQEIKKNLTLWEPEPREGPNAIKPPSRIKSYLCPNDCSEKGRCMNGICHCNDKYIGADCSVMKNQAPEVWYITNKGICDTRARPCHGPRIVGKHFVDSDSLTCHIQILEESTDGTQHGENVTVAATFLTFEEVLCPIASIKNRRKKRGTEYLELHPETLSKYLVMISNDGEIVGEQLMYITYDSYCQACQGSGSDVCVKKLNSCLIGGECFEAGTWLPYKECYGCNPKIDTTQWTYTPGCLLGWHIGAVCGVAAFILICIIVLLIVCYWRKRQKKYSAHKGIATGNQVTYRVQDNEDNCKDPMLKKSIWKPEEQESNGRTDISKENGQNGRTSKDAETAKLV